MSEIEKYIAREKDYECLSTFLSWLLRENIFFCKEDKYSSRGYVDITETPREIVLRYLGIDESELKQEEETILRAHYALIRRKLDEDGVDR